MGQMKKQEKALQEEVKRLTEELADALKLIKELQGESKRISSPQRIVFVCVGPALLHTSYVFASPFWPDFDSAPSKIFLYKKSVIG